MEEKFTIEEFKNYLMSRDGLGDAVCELTAENIRKSNLKEGGDRFYDDCRFYDYAQGKKICSSIESPFNQCEGVCEYFEAKRIKK